MAKNKKSVVEKEIPKNRGGRQNRAKSYNKGTLMKLVKRYKPTHSVL